MAEIPSDQPNDDQTPMEACKHCNRTFRSEARLKHEPNCPETKKRQPFDSGKKRAEGSDISIESVQKVREELEKGGGKFSPRETKWREQHKELLNKIGEAKQQTANGTA